MTDAKFYKLETYVQADHAEAVKAALAAAGAGRWGAYDRCFWSTAGTGEFRPLAGANPFLGRVGEVETVHEVKLETLCPADRVDAVIAALKASHPYEVPAFYLTPVPGPELTESARA